MQKQISLFLLAAVLLAACAAPVVPSDISPEDQLPTIAPEIDEVTAAVEAFGLQLQQVSLLALDAADQIQQQYAGFVTPDLLQAWVADPASAPGRLTSSPWPDHIQVLSVEPQSGGEYLVQAVVAEADSEGLNSDNMLPGYPIELRVVSQDGQWLISAYTVVDQP